VQAGDLVRITRASIGVSKGTVALIISTLHAAGVVRGRRHGSIEALFEVQLLPNKTRNVMFTRRYYGRDLKIINASR